MTTSLTPDLCVIGAGAGGLSIAAGAARLGLSVVLVEKGAMGGDCLNHGCIPSKALIAAASAAKSARDAWRFGICVSEPEVDWPALRRHIKDRIAAIAPMDSQSRYEAMGVQVIRASARFTNDRTLEAGGLSIRARRFVIATGSAPVVPTLSGLDLIRPLTNETIFDLEAPPKRLIVLGGGAVGCELAQAFQRLGCIVTIIEAARCLGREDPEIAAAALAAMAREGIVIREEARVSRLEPCNAGVRLTLSAPSFSADGAQEETIEGSHLLLATGRRPNTGGLHLEAAGVDYDARGVKVSAGQRTNNPRIYAIGDVADGGGAGRLTPFANYQATIALQNILLRIRRKMKPQLVPRVIFTDPEIASVGLDETQAREKYSSIRILRWPFAECDRATVERAREGHIKAVVTRGGRILGCSIVGRGAGDLIAPWALALARGLKIQTLAHCHAPYPTRTEVSRRAAIGYYSDKLNSIPLRRIIYFLRRFG